MDKEGYQITNQILKNISSIEASKALIENSPLLPLYERQFMTEAIVRKVHYSTAIEGNYLKLDEVRKVLGPQDPDSNFEYQSGSGYIKKIQDESGIDVVARKRDITEVINYRNVVKHIETLVKDSNEEHSNLDSASINAGNPNEGFILTDDIIKNIHSILLENIMDDSAGIYRVGKAITINYVTGEKLDPYEDVTNIEDKMDALIDWYNNSEVKESIHPVLKAGLLHLELVRIHPFEEGNGRLARAMATLSLSLDGYDVNHFFCLDEYYDSNAGDYYDALSAGFEESTKWLEYFSLGMAIEFNRIKDRVVKMSKDAKVKKRSGQTFITQRQEKIIEWINSYGYFRNQDFNELFPDISDDTVLRELYGLLDADIIVKRGKTKSARYEFK